MERLTGYLRLTGRRIASMSPGMRVVVVVLAMLAVCGAVWLVLATVRPATVPLRAEPITPRRLADLRGELDRRGISYRIEAGRLCVPAEHLDAARAILGGLRARASAAIDDLRKLADRDDIWSSQAQNDRRWQVAKMALLSEQISSLSGIDSATVILSPGSSGRFGRPGRTGGASVKLAMQAGMQADVGLCETIADMVTVSVTGLRRQDVCVVDGRGRSYRPAPAPPGDGIIARTRQAEAYYAARVRKALSYIDGLIVSVRAVGSMSNADRIGPCAGVSVSIPRSYLSAARRHHGAGQRLEDFASARESDVVRAVMCEVALADPGAVTVRWYHDAPRETAAAAAAGAVGKRSTGESGFDLGGWAVGVAAVLLVGCLVWRRAARGAGRLEEGQAQARAAAGAKSNAPAAERRAGGPFAFLLETPAEELGALLEGEHPQTIALVLAHLGPGKAAAVLAGLEPERQVDVVRRIASLGAPAGEVAGEIARGLAARMGIGTADGDDAGGISTAAEILHHVGYDGEQAVLEGLKDGEPALAETIRRRMFEFEDIAALSPETVGRALAGLPSDDIAVALRTAGEGVRQKVLAGLAGEASGQVRQAMDRIGPVRLSDVEAAQQRVAAAMRRAGSGRYVRDDAESRAGDYVEAGSEQ